VYTAQKIAETKMKIIEGVKSTEDLNVLLRVGWGAETTNRMSFKPADDLKVGDELSITLEKLVEVVEEPKTEAAIKPAENVEGTAETTPVAKAAPKSESEAPCACASETATEVVAEEKKEGEPPTAEEAKRVCEAGAGAGAEAETPCSCTCAAEPAVEAKVEEKEAEPPVDKIGEVEGVVATNVSQENNPRFLLRVVYKKKSEEAPITLEESLKPNDKVRVTIIRTVKAPEPDAAEGAALAGS